MLDKGITPHASTDAEAASIASVSVNLETGGKLVRALDEILDTRSRVFAYYKALPSITVYYEDLVESSELYNQTWSSVLAFIGAPLVPFVIFGDQLVIHANKPLLSSVRNADVMLSSLRPICKSRRRHRYGTLCDELGIG